MRVLVFCPCIGTESGSGIRARLIVEGLRFCGVDVGVVARDVPPGVRETGVTIFPLREEHRAEGDISRAAGSFRPDIVYGITETWADAVVDAARGHRVPVAFDLHGLGIVEILELGSGFGPRKPRVKNSLRWLSRIREADVVTVANPRLVPVVRWLNPRTEPVIGMTDVERFRPDGGAIRLGSNKEAIQVLYAGNYYRWQGVHLLLEAIRQVLESGDPFEFTLIGSVGREAGQAETWQSRFSANRVRFLDSVGYERIADYYRGADVSILPRPFLFSTYLAFPQKLVDSMASGRVVVATDIAPHRWALGSPEAGVLCPPSTEGIVDGIRRTQDQKLRDRISQNSRRVAVDRFCHRRQTRRIRDIFQGILGGN